MLTCSGHTYYYNKETKKSTYTRPVAEIPPFQTHLQVAPSSNSLPPRPQHDDYSQSAQPAYDPQQKIQDLIFGGAPRQAFQHNGPQRGGHRGGSRGGQNNFSERRREKDDRPKHRNDIPNCAPWVLVKTKFGRRFVWNKETNESFWKYPPHVMKAVVEMDRKQRERKERRERGEPSDVEDEEDTAMADIEAELAAGEEEVEIVEVDGEIHAEGPLHHSPSVSGSPSSAGQE